MSSPFLTDWNAGRKMAQELKELGFDLESIRCRKCGSIRIPDTASVDDSWIVRCRSCQLVFQNFDIADLDEHSKQHAAMVKQ